MSDLQRMQQQFNALGQDTLRDERDYDDFKLNRNQNEWGAQRPSNSGAFTGRRHTEQVDYRNRF